MIKKLSALVLASALAASTAVFAAPPGAPGGFENQGGYGYNDYYGGPRGFGNELNTVAAVKKNASDDQHVTLTGRLVNYLGHDRYEFADNTGTIEVELDDDYNWSMIAKGQLIQIFGTVDRDFFFTSIDVKRAIPVDNLQNNMQPR